MDANLDKIALDLYGKIQTRFPNIKIGDENATVLSKKEDIPRARFFEFEYEENGAPLGTIAITLDLQDGIVMQISGDIADSGNTKAYQFIRSFRQFAKNRLLKFDIQNIGKSNLDKRDYQFQAKRKEEPVMAQPAIMESTMYGTNRISYQDLGEARLVIKHNQAVDANVPGARTMHIESIYIENAQGERFKYPFKHLNGARALAEHIKHNGTPYDAIGKHITSLSEELAQLRKFKGYVTRNETISEAMGTVTSKVMERIEQVKKEIMHLQRPAYYESFAESFEEKNAEEIPEDVIENLVDRLTIRTFNEELKAVFPYIVGMLGEDDIPVRELGVEDILGEEGVDEGVMKNIKRGMQGWYADATDINGEKMTPKDVVRRNKNYDDETLQRISKAVNGPGPGFPFSNAKTKHSPADLQKRVLDREMKKRGLGEQGVQDYESFMEAIVAEDDGGIFSNNGEAQSAAIDELNQLMSKELKGGPEGVNAIESLKGLIDDEEFIQSLADIDPDLDVRPLVQQYVQSVDPKVAKQIDFDGEAEAEPAPEPAPIAAPEPAPQPAAQPAPAPAGELPPLGQAPVAEDAKLAKLKAKFIKAKEAGAELDTTIDFGDRELTLQDALDECGIMPEDVGFAPEVNSLEEMLKFVSSFYNREEKNFPLGGQRVKIKVKKAFEDGEFGNASKEDLIKVLKFIEKKDPSGNEHNQIIRLAGVNTPEIEIGEDNLSDLENQFKNIKLNVGGQELDFQDPNVQDKILKMFGGAMQQATQGQLPDQNVQFPGGQMNPAQMMQQLLGKLPK